MTALDRPYGDPGGKRESAELALRMQRLGVSCWHIPASDVLAGLRRAHGRRFRERIGVIRWIAMTM